MSTRLSSVLSSSGNYYPRSKHCSSCSILRFDFRLQYYNLKNSRSQNALALEEVQGLWIPFLVFDNTENNEATRGTEDTEVTITRSAFSITDHVNTRREAITFYHGLDVSRAMVMAPP